ncbi:LacI family DNA-binding transcriptional regulator [Thermoclostridium caenicola]|uniref:LacI family DNA-binding transcriptional regulator n=1 Tax=Thermoclostridium caenicola TaxID=659425 RepID=UPI00122C4875|nr:LacI family DNA-binding transcriptional regulator [Thermoclostridium caenicola]
MREKRVTIKDVAALAGVSVATVSRVLSNADYPVSKELRSKVEQAAKELSFAYTSAPRSSKAYHDKEIAVVIPNISNPFYMQTINGISTVCYEKGYQMLLCNSMQDVEREEQILQDLYSRRVTGVIVSSISEDPRLLAKYTEKGMTFIQLDQNYEGSGVYSINYDSRLGARIAVRHLIENGHKRIAFISTPLTRWTRREIYKGYLEQLKKTDIEYDEKLVFIADTDGMGNLSKDETRTGAAMARKLVESKCNATAILCVNDMVAFGAIHALNEMGVAVPDDISVVGFDDIPLAESFVPALTTVHFPAYETGRIAAIMLIDYLANGKQSNTPLKMNMEPRLVERRSVRNLCR